jgi:hypothetical protein
MIVNPDGVETVASEQQAITMTLPAVAAPGSVGVNVDAVVTPVEPLASCTSVVLDPPGATY